MLDTLFDLAPNHPAASRSVFLIISIQISQNSDLKMRFLLLSSRFGKDYKIRTTERIGHST